MNEQVHAFARAHRLKSARGADNAVTIPGRAGAIYAFDCERLACHIESRTVRARNVRVRNCESQGMVLVQDGDTEAVLTFDPNRPTHVELALKVAGIRRRKVPSEAQLVALKAARLTRRGCVQNAG